MNYRDSKTGSVFTDKEVRALHNTSFKADGGTFKDLGYDEVTPSERPAPSTSLKRVFLGSPVGSGSDWSESWEEEDIFSEPNKAEKEADHLAMLATASWKSKMAAIDSEGVTGPIEQLMDAMISGDPIDSFLVEIYDRKKAERAKKP